MHKGPFGRGFGSLIAAALAKLVLLCGLAVSQVTVSNTVSEPGQDTEAEVLVGFRTQPPVVDGDLGEVEWAEQPQVILQRLDQVWRPEQRGEWGGSEDLSAEFYISYDRHHLYLAGEVRDNSLVIPERGEEWYTGDAVELFLNLDLDDDVGEGGHRIGQPFNEDDLQIFLMPLSRPSWGVMNYAADPPRPGSLSLTGFRVAGKRRPDGYQFEAAIPLHNFEALNAVNGRIGFNLALDDHDEGTARYQYMTWTGANPVTPEQDTSKMGRLVFAGPAPLAEADEPGIYLSPTLLSDLPYLLVPLGAVGLLFVLWRLWTPVRHRFPRLRPVLLVAGVTTFGVGLLLPGEWMGRRERQTQADLAEVTDTLQAAVAEMERGTLASYRGAQRDEALMELLAGGEIPPQLYWEHRPLVELLEGGFGEEPWEFPQQFFPVLPYWIPLPANELERIDFAEPLVGDLLYVVVARPHQPFLALEGEGLPRLRLNLQASGGGIATVHDPLELDRVFEDASDFDREGWEVTYKVVELQESVSTLSVTALDRDDLVLVGLSFEPVRGEGARPLLLGQASLGGVETDLRGPYPATAGLELASNERRSLEISRTRSEPFEKLWMFYRATYPGTLTTVATGAVVAQVTVNFREDGIPPLEVELEHQVSMLFELDRHNSAAEDLQGPVGRAFEWEDEDRELHVNLVREVDLPEGATVRSLEFANEAPYRIRFRSVVFGSPKPGAPQDVGDSPLLWSETGGRLKPEIKAKMQLADFAVYRDGRLSESSMSETEEEEHLALPREVQQQLAADQRYSRRVGSDGEHVLETYDTLSGDGWQGAALGVFMADKGHAADQRRSNTLGTILLLLSTPVLLVLLSDVLSVLGNLRLRLIAVLSAATLVPLGILSVILVGVLSRGHEADLEQSMRQGMAAARAQLQEQGRTLSESADTWLGALVGDRIETEEIEDLPRLMEQKLRDQLPPDWESGFLRLDFVPDAETPAEAFSLSVGQTALAGAETPLRPEPAMDMAWGEPILGVSVEEEGLEGRYTLSVGRALDAGLLRTLAPDRTVLLMDTRGYPLVVAPTEAGPAPDAVGRSAMETMPERGGLLDQVLDRGQPVVSRQPGPDGGWLVGYDVLRDARATPRALLALMQPDQRATLDLPVGQVPVRAFFMLGGGLVMLLSVFLSLLVTSRISGPIERLEHGARALSRGELDVQVESEERGQIGRLTRTFNQMAQELRGRMRDLRLLNRGIQDLSSSTLELTETLKSVRGFCSEHSPADQVCVALLERDRNRVELYGESVQHLDLHAPDVQVLLSASGPFSMRRPPSSVLTETSSLHSTAHGDTPGSAVVLPMILGGRAVGAVVLLFRTREPEVVNLELLTTVATQAATAVVNAQLYRHAVRDPYTGAFMPEHFHRRVVQEVGGAQARGQSLALLGFRLRDRAQVEGLDTEAFARVLERMSAQLQEHMPEDGFMCHRGEGQFEVLLPGVQSQQAQVLLDTWLSHLGQIEEVVGAMARYPEDAVSAEFLFDALRSGLATGAVIPGATPEQEPAAHGVLPGSVLPGSPGMREVYLTLRKVAPTDLTILLEGETGTGKEILTDNIHRWSRRGEGPLVKVHCAALSETLLQSELFGHEKGAFTGATGRKIGRFELAQGGTIFLDEIGEISLEVQVQLLRVLQEREIDRVGGTAPVPVDVRVIAATNRDLVEMVGRGSFREDLYYRLQGMVVRVPPLRERKQEIPSLVEHFRREAVEAGHTRVEGFSADAMDELFLRDWPGNIRELRNACFRAMVLASGAKVERSDLMGILTSTPGIEPELTREPKPGTGPEAGGEPESPEPVVTLPRPRPEVRLEGRLQALRDLVARQGSISTEEYADRSGLSARTGLRDLQELVTRGHLERVGKRRGARYRLPPGSSDQVP